MMFEQTQRFPEICFEPETRVENEVTEDAPRGEDEKIAGGKDFPGFREPQASSSLPLESRS